MGTLRCVPARGGDGDLLPAAGFGVLVRTNGSPIGVPETFGLTVLDLVQQGQVSRDWLATVASAFATINPAASATGVDWEVTPVDPTPAESDDAYLGMYYDDYCGEAEIAEADNGLELRIGPALLVFPLTHYDRDTFTREPPLDTGIPRSGLTFTIGPAGTAIAFHDECLATDGPGIVPRREEAKDVA